MKLDPKYFNLFIGICALLTLIAIIYGTINYTQKQANEFRDSIAEVQLDTLSLGYIALPDTLNMSELHGDPVLIQFWSTWSGRSMSVNAFLREFNHDHPELKVIAAAVRDGEEQLQEYIDKQEDSFYYVNGTPFFQELLVPGVPSQILVKRDGTLHDTQVGEDIDSLREKLQQLLREGQ
ncbi:MAG: hypothetical protein JJU46_10660 [Balneolaceae bacterium]|nr:hypothetical protein [Balneolaceae bacterium]MCH8548599.1 hypothetical protein [Balneolaceae bacterium]